MTTFTAQDNARLKPALVDGAAGYFGREIAWEPAGPKDQIVFKSNPDLANMGDNMCAIAHTDAGTCWVLQNDWHGFPDPPEFLFVAFRGQGEVSALKYFDDWPANWTKPETVH